MTVREYFWQLLRIAVPVLVVVIAALVPSWIAVVISASQGLVATAATAIPTIVVVVISIVPVLIVACCCCRCCNRRSSCCYCCPHATLHRFCGLENICNDQEQSFKFFSWTKNILKRLNSEFFVVKVFEFQVSYHFSTTLWVVLSPVQNRSEVNKSNTFIGVILHNISA